MKLSVRKDQPIHLAIFELKKALGMTPLDHWEYNMSPTKNTYEIYVNDECLPPYRMEEDLFIWKMKYT